jgi:hypothetical protein
VPDRALQLLASQTILKVLENSMFQKSAIALAAFIVAATAQATDFNLGKDTTFEVNVDVGAYHLSEKDASGKTEKSFLGKGLNQVEVKGSHAVGDGLKVFGEIEIDYDPIGDNGTILTDDNKFGVDSKAFGKFTIGQFDSYFEDNVAEALGAGHGDTAFVTEAGTGNDGRHLQYLKSVGDLTFAYDLTFDTSSADATKSATGSALTLVYKIGDLKIALGTDKISKYKNTGAAATADSTTGITATYKLTKEMALTALSIKAKNLDNTNTKYTGFKVAYDMGAVDLTLASQRVKPSNSSTSRTETTYGIGYEAYKNMTVYLDMSKMDKANGEGDVTEIGMKYSF